MMIPALSLLIYRYDKFCGAVEIKYSRYLNDSDLSEKVVVMRPQSAPPQMMWAAMNWYVLVFTFYMIFLVMSKL